MFRYYKLQIYFNYNYEIHMCFFNKNNILLNTKYLYIKCILYRNCCVADRCISYAPACPF